ncbi:hypothetical protein ACWEHA_15175 [Amycolatopsis nivea]
MNYATYYAVNYGPFQRMGNGVVNPRSGGIFYHKYDPEGGYFKVNGTTGLMYCLDVRADSWPVDHVNIGTWYECAPYQ